MFILIPTIIIFLSSAYIYLNDNISFYLEIVLYLIMIATIYLSYRLYKNIKIDVIKQNINSILMEIQRLEIKLTNEKDKIKAKGLTKKIILLKDEIKKIKY